jgi:glycosyltransferase involved in cell wall biosynthesis
MKILLIIDQFDNSNNGTTISARRFAKGLEKAGHEVRIISTGNPNKNKYVVKEMPLTPIVSHIIKSQGMTFAMPNNNVLLEAVKDVDIVHFYMPFFFSTTSLKTIEKLNIPHTAAFHVQPENITYTIGLGTNKNVNNCLYTHFRDNFYNRFTHIHCPSNFIANELKAHGYTANMHVISNGVDSSFVYHKNEKPQELKDKFVITMIGRYSNEKRQDVLIDAIQKSKYANKIQLVLAGKGPKENTYRKLGEKLANPPIMKFFGTSDLQNLLGYTDLYVHSADAEIEAISCIEAFACGNVPVIANSPNSATPQFALHENSLFTPGDSTDLANKIDFWIENPELKEEMEHKYADSAEQYRIEKSIKQIERMFENAISEYKNNG